jgi:hypothetical protein
MKIDFELCKKLKCGNRISAKAKQEIVWCKISSKIYNFLAIDCETVPKNCKFYLEYLVSQNAE